MNQKNVYELTQERLKMILKNSIIFTYLFLGAKIVGSC